MATDLFQQVMDYDYGAEARAKLMREVWEDVPWMINAFTGGCGDDRDCAMWKWCRERFGDEHLPIHGRPGLWQRGGATIYGWTWYGFATEEMMLEFQAAWPNPATDKPPSA